MTEWRNVPGFEGRYQVNADGEVRPLARPSRWGAQTITLQQRILKPAHNPGGSHVTLSLGGRRRTYTILALLRMAGLEDRRTA